MSGYVATLSSGGSLVASNQVSSVTTNITFSGLTNGQSYAVSVFSYVNNDMVGGAGGIAGPVTGVPGTVPSVPTSYSVNPSSQTLSLTWGAPTNNGGYSITSYVISQNGSVVQTTSSAPASITGLSNGTTYTVSVAASNFFGVGPSVSSNAVPALGHPSAPINVVLAPTNTAIGVSWGPPTNNGGTAITSYQVLVNGSNGPTSATTNANVTGLTNGVSYAISVEASNSVGFGTPSAVQYGIPFTVPSVPTAFIATGTNTGLHLTWGAPTNNGGNAVTGYDVYLAGAFNQHVTNLAASLTNLVNGSTYAVSVAASNAAGDGALVSSNAIPCTVPGAVTGLQFPDLSTKTATNILLGVTFPATSSYGGGADGTSSTNAPYVNNNSYLYVTWGNPATNGGSAITGYAVYNGTNLAYTTNASTLWGGLGGMANGTTNSVGVAAVNVAGTGPITTLWGIPSTVPPDINNQSGWNVGLEYGSVSAGSNSITISGVIDGGNGGAPIDYYIGYTMSPSVYAGVTNYSYVMNYYTPAGEVIPLIGSQEGGIFISQPGDTNQHRYMGDIVLKATNGQKNYVFLAPHNINGFGGTLDPTLNQYIGTCLGLYTPAATWAVTTSSTNTSRANTNIGITSSVGSSWTSGTANGSPLLVFNISPLIDSNGFDAAEFTGFTPYNVTGRSLSLSHMFVSSYMGGTYCGTGPGTYTYSVQASETVSSGATYTGYGTGTVTLTDVAPTTTLFPANGVATNYTIVSPINLCAEVYEPDYFYRMSATSYAVLNGQTSSVVNCGGPTKTGVYNASNSSYYVFYNAFTNIPPGEYTAIAYSTGPFGSTDTATLAINVIRNLVIYYNAGDALITNVYTLNLAGVGDTNMSNFLTGLNQTQLSNAITIAASTVATNASFAATNATTSVLYSQSTNAATNTYEAYSGVIAIGQENQGADMISAANAHLANIDWSNTNYYDTADVSNLLNDSLSPSNLGMAGHTGNWSMGFYRMVTNTTVTRTDVYQHHTLGTFSTSYSAGKFVVIDADTGLILGDVSSTGPNSFSSLSYGLPINFYGDTGWTNLTSMTGPLNFAGQITGLVLGSTGVATNAGAVTTYSINYTTLSNTTNYTPWYEASQWSPITIDLSGSPDFLADQWRAVPHPPNWMAMRKYNLDGTGEKLWEWVGPTEGILIWNPTGDPHLVPSAANMFSLSFQGKHFANGFDAISSLDESGSHILKGKILNSIWVWVDANGNGKIDKGELKPLTSLGIKWLDISHSTDNQGGLFNDHGAETDGNKSYPLRDWWSQGGIAPAEADSFLQDCLKGPPIYLWTPDNGYENPLATKSPFQDKVVPFLNCPLGGYFRFDAIGDSISVLMDRVFADTGKHVKALTTKLTVIDGLFAWDVPIGDSSVLKTRFVLSKDLTKLYGVTEVSERGVPKGQFTWTADHVSGPLLTDLLFAFTRLQKKH